MKILGIVGGIAPESTIDYYRRLLNGYRKRRPDSGNPQIIINSIDLKRMLSLVGDPPALTDFMVDEVSRLATAGSDVGLFGSNTPHLVFDEVQQRSPIPLISIVQATLRTARTIGVQRLALFGTRFTMEGVTYTRVFNGTGIDIIPPTLEERNYIHEHYLGELAEGVFRDETRTRFQEIIDRMKIRDSIDGVILGGTELPLLLTESKHSGLPLLDTTQIHVEAALEELVKD